METRSVLTIFSSMLLLIPHVRAMRTLSSIMSLDKCFFVLRALQYLNIVSAYIVGITNNSPIQIFVGTICGQILLEWRVQKCYLGDIKRSGRLRFVVLRGSCIFWARSISNIDTNDCMCFFLSSELHPQANVPTLSNRPLLCWWWKRIALWKIFAFRIFVCWG